MKILAVGLAARDAAALGILAALAIKDARCDSVAYRRGQALPAADLYVVDLIAVGLSRWSVAAEAELLQMLHGRPAVVLRPVREEAWSQVHAGIHGAQPLVWLTKPYGSEAMRQALQAAVSPPAPASKRLPTMRMGVRPAAPLPATETSALPKAGSPAAPVAPTPAVLPAPNASCVLTPQDLAALHTAFPELKDHAVLAHMVKALGSGRPHELRLSLQYSIVLFPSMGWVATNATHDVIERVCQNETLATAASLRELSEAQAQDRVAQLGVARAALDPFLWGLASATLGTQAPRLARDAQLRLKGFPDYTRLPRVPDFFIQLAAICVRLPQTLTELQAAFPGCDSRDIKRFAFFCATSGLGQLSLVAGAPVRSTGGPPRPATRVATHQGFFAALLHKLF